MCLCDNIIGTWERAVRTPDSSLWTLNCMVLLQVFTKHWSLASLLTWQLCIIAFMKMCFQLVQRSGHLASIHLVGTVDLKLIDMPFERLILFVLKIFTMTWWALPVLVSPLLQTLVAIVLTTALCDVRLTHHHLVAELAYTLGVLFRSFDEVVIVRTSGHVFDFHLHSQTQMLLWCNELYLYTSIH